MLAHKHLILKGSFRHRLNVADVTHWISELVEKLGMKLVEHMPVNPCVGYEDGEDCGVSGVAIITTSHIVLHTWDNTNEFQLDVYSCKEFEPSLVNDELKSIGFTVDSQRFFDREYNIIDLEL